MKIIKHKQWKDKFKSKFKTQNKKTKIRTQNVWDQKYTHIFIIIKYIYKQKNNKIKLWCNIIFQIDVEQIKIMIFPKNIWRT